MTDNYYQSMIEHAPIGYVCYKIIHNENTNDQDYQFVELNKKFVDIIGMQKEEVIGQQVSDIFRGQPNWLRLHNTIQKQAQEVESTSYFDGINNYYKINRYEPDSDHLVLFFNDVTPEEKKTQNYNLFADNTKLHIWRLSDSFTYRFANKAHADFLGLDKKEVIDKKITEIYPTREATVMIEGNKRVFTEKKKIRSKEWIVNAQGEKRLLNILKNPKYNQDGEVEFISCSAEDITEEYKLEEDKKVRENILFSMVYFIEELLTNGTHYGVLANSLENLGKATEVDRVYYWENHYDEVNEEWLASQKFEWCLDGVKQQVDNPALQNNSFEVFDDFIGVLAQNKAFITHVKEMEDTPTKEILKAQNIQSILVLPVFIQDKFTGFIGFDSCRFEREWTDVERYFLESFVLLYEKALEKTLTEKYLIQVKKNFDNFFNMVDDFLMVFDQQGIIINANDTVLEALNYSRNELIGQSATKIHPKESLELSENRMKKIISGEEMEFSARALTKEGETVPIETHVSPGIWDGKDVFFSVATDVSRLRMSEEKFSTAFNLSGISMIILSIEKGEFIEINDAFLDLVGYEREEIVGQEINKNDIFKLNDFNETEIREAIKVNDRIDNYEMDMITKKGELRTGLFNIVTITINDQLYFLTSIIDVTESKRLNKELSQAKIESDSANQAKSKFLSHISHEIRTPMNAVIGYSELLTTTLLTEKQEQYIEGIKASTAMLMSIINDILDWSKVDESKLELEYNQFTIEDVLNSVVGQQQFKKTKTGKNIVEIIVEKSEEVPSVLYGDSLRLQQTLLNLVSNAVKFTEEGEIRITIDVAERTYNHVSLRFDVMDTGIGIAKEILPDIFEPFKQAGNHLIGTHGGTGLGLSICKNIVDSMGGQIGVESTEGKGSRFFFVVDFDTECTKEITESQINPEKNPEDYSFSLEKLTNSQVLIVDDNRINQDVLKEILEDVGVLVSIASSGQQAIEKVKTKDFDLVLMDLRMPKMNGYEATKKIRTMKEAVELPIIAVSASVSTEKNKKCEVAGMQAFISKPIVKDKLYDTMSQLLPADLDKKRDYRWDRSKAIIPDVSAHQGEYIIDGIAVEKALDHLNQNEALFLRILKRFKTNYEHVVDEINQAIQDEDRELATRLAHTVKGVSGELSADEVFSIATELEKELKHQSSKVPELIKQLDTALDRIFKASIFQEEEKDDEDEVNNNQLLDIKAIQPILTELGQLLKKSDMDGLDLIETLAKKTKGTWIHKQVQKMQRCGEQYDFEGSLSHLEKIENLLNKRKWK